MKVSNRAGKGKAWYRKQLFPFSGNPAWLSQVSKAMTATIISINYHCLHYHHQPVAVQCNVDLPNVYNCLC